MQTAKNHRSPVKLADAAVQPIAEYPAASISLFADAEARRILASCELSESEKNETRAVTRPISTMADTMRQMQSTIGITQTIRAHHGAQRTAKCSV